VANPLGVWELATGAIAGIAIGQALEDAVAPTFEVLTQTSWRNHPTKVLDPATAAQVDAQRLGGKVDTQDDAQRNGVGAARYSLLQQLAHTAPGVAEALTLWRRGDVETADFVHALEKAALEQRWLEPLQQLYVDRLDIASIANGVQQGFLPNPGVLPVTPTTAPGRVETVAAQNIDVLAEARSQGYDLPRLRVLAGLAGLPPGPETLLMMLRRNIIERSDVERGIAQGHTKTEWTDAYLELAKAILTPSQAATLRLKGWISAQESYEIGALSGVGPADMDLLYQAGGRPPAPGQMATAVARGFATEADFERAIVESDIRPEWAALLYAIRHNYPPLFQVERLLGSGTISDADATEWLTYDRYPPDVVAALVKGGHKAKVATVKELTRADVLTFYQARYIDAATARTDLTNLGYTAPEVDLLLEHADAQRVLRYLNSVVNKVESQYVGWKTTRQLAESELGAAGIGGSARDELLALWDVAREANRPRLTAAQILTLLQHDKITPQGAHDSLVARGYSDLGAAAEVSRYAPFGVPGSLQTQVDGPIDGGVDAPPTQFPH